MKGKKNFTGFCNTEKSPMFFNPDPDPGGRFFADLTGFGSRSETLKKSVSSDVYLCRH